MSKSIKRKILTLMLVGAIATPMASFANNTTKPVKETEIIPISMETEDNNYIKFTGVIANVNSSDNYLSVWGNSDVEEDEYGVVFNISDDVTIWDRTTEEIVKHDSLKEGMKFEVYYPENTPVALSLPPQLTPEIVIIQGKEYVGSSYVGEFDNNLVSKDNFLKLNITEDTVIISEKGQAVNVEDIYDSHVLVFYDAATKSIPAQTVPSKIVLLSEKDETDNTEENVEEVQEPKEMIELRDIAENAGYKIEWDGKNKIVILRKGNSTIGIKIGDVNYSLNKSIRKFDRAPELKDGVTYVESSILDIVR